MLTLALVACVAVTSGWWVQSLVLPFNFIWRPVVGARQRTPSHALASWWATRNPPNLKDDGRHRINQYMIRDSLLIMLTATKAIVKAFGQCRRSQKKADDNIA